MTRSALLQLIAANISDAVLIIPEKHREVENEIINYLDALVPPGPFVLTVKANPVNGDPDNPTQVGEGDTITHPAFAGWDIITIAAGNVLYADPYFQKDREETTITMRQGVQFFENAVPETILTITLGKKNSIPQ